MQLHAPEPVRATVTGLFFVVLGTLYPAAAAIHGVLADVLGVARVTVGGSAALALALMALATTAPRLLVAARSVATACGTLTPAPPARRT